MDFMKLIKDRFSVRKFKPEHLKKEVIDEILLAGHVAPTGCNYQPQRILVLNTDESMKKLSKCTPCHFNAPTAMVIGYNKNESWVRKYDKAMTAPVDAAIVATHMMLSAQSLGVGSCMVMAYNPEILKNEFNIPDEYEMTLILVMGYPADDAVPLDMHEKVRPIEETVFYEKF